MKHQKLFQRLKYIVTAIACINLVLLFLFHYELPSFIKHKLNKGQETALVKETMSTKDTLTIHFDEEKITYKGKGDLNLTKGVTVTKENGVEVKASLFSEIKKGAGDNERIVTYIAEDSYGNTGTADRILVLKGYDGPSISIKDNYPTIDDTELNSLASIFKDSGAISATDGYKNDITSSIETSYEITDMSSKQIKIKFNVTNMFGDTAVKTLDLPLERTGPLVVLTQDTVTLAVGTVFLPASYIASATDKDGNDISAAVATEGDIDTNKAGTYRITYKLTDAQGREAAPVSLKITVN